ncbi:MAG: S16 family serine protease [Candidatus Micrarchaeota archaeon]
MKALLLFLLAVVAVLAVYLGYSTEPRQPVVSTPSPAATTDFISTPSAAPFASPSIEPLAGGRTLSLKLPAAASDGGVLAELTVSARPAASAGRPRNWIPVPDPSNPIVNNDTQVSLSVAAEYARAFAEADSSGVDLFYALTAPSVAVGGRSAGAAAAIAAIALLEEKPLRNDTLITGAIEPDGRITRVGRVLDKARAVREGGYSVFLVPVGESFEGVQRTAQNQSCTTEYVEGVPFTSCRTQSTTWVEQVNVSEETGIQVIEVANVSQAYELMREAVE